MKLDGKYNENFLKLFNVNNENTVLSTIKSSDYQQFTVLTSVLNNIEEVYENCLFLRMDADWPFDTICYVLEKIFDDYTLLIDEDKEYERKCLLIKNDIKFDEDFFIDINLSRIPNCLSLNVYVSSSFNHSASLDIPSDYFITKRINEKNPELFKEFTRAISIIKTEAEENLKFYTNLYNQISDEDKLYMEVSE